MLKIKVVEIMLYLASAIAVIASINTLLVTIMLRATEAAAQVRLLYEQLGGFSNF